MHMTDPAAASSPAPLPLLSRIIGVITSPKATFQNIVAAPRPFGVLFVVATVIGIGAIAPQFTEKGRVATLQSQVQFMERLGSPMTPEAYAAAETRSHSVPLRLVGLAGTYIVLPIITLIFAGLYWAAFNTAMGGTASFKQVLAIVTHSQVIGALGMIAALPISLSTGKMTQAGPYNLGALAPMLEQGSTLAVFLGSISVFSLWSFFVTAIGLGVLYRRKSTTIAIVLISIFLIVMFVVASMFGKYMAAAS
jgi:hypothetical protein